ncbi:serine protein kinase RIO [Candidatus Woesearchaeota archaeon]|nr:serine protein kinase RIO [Candidatus Woesearchaeota archaeon]
MAKITREKHKTYKAVFDEVTERNLFKLSSQGHFEELKNPFSIGKEANIFTAIKKDKTQVIVKIYRVQNANFNQMYNYLKQDPRALSLKKNRRQVVFSWTKREYRNLLLARQNIKVPTPHAQLYNIIVMELIGDVLPSPQLKNATPANINEFYDKTIENMKKLYKSGLVHGDLSEFNILNYNEHPVFIDFSQSTITKSHNAKELLERDIKNMYNYFTKKGVKTTIEQINKKITGKI